MPLPDSGTKLNAEEVQIVETSTKSMVKADKESTRDTDSMASGFLELPVEVTMEVRDTSQHLDMRSYSFG